MLNFTVRNNQKNIILFITATIIFGGFSLALAAFNERINYQGKLTNSNNVPVADGDYTIKFNLYTTASGGSPIWTENWDGTGGRAKVTIHSGLFSVMLGTYSSLADVDFNQTLYLGVTVESDNEMTPRKEIGAVPAAFEAKKLGGKTWAIPDAIGTTTPNSGAFTTLSSTYSGASTALIVNQSGAGLLVDIQKAPLQNSPLITMAMSASGRRTLEHCWILVWPALH